MRVDVEPFTDVRVRRAFRLLINRPQVVKQGLSGYGRVGNDIYSPFDPAYAGDEFPQRQYDPEQAKSLLKAAGKEGLAIEVITSPADTGMVEGATIFAENAKAGGLKVTVKNVDGGTIYGDQYLKWTFSADYWGTRNYLQQVAAGVLTTAPFNETHWEKYEKYAQFEALYRRALATVDTKKRTQIIKDMQQMEYQDGGLIIWGFKNLTDAYSTKVGGFKIDRGTLNLNKYGNGYRTIYFT
jgi:peptide/nickel transport system substrate-binding protein